MRLLALANLLALATALALAACGEAQVEPPAEQQIETAAAPLYRDAGFYGMNVGIYDIFMTSTASHPSLSALTGDFTFEARVKILETSTGDAMAGFTLFDDGNGSGHNFGIFPNQDKWVIYDGTTRSYIKTVPEPGGFEIGRWYKMKAQVKAGRLHFFIDDVPRSSPEGFPAPPVFGIAELRARNSNALFDDVVLRDGNGSVVYSWTFDSDLSGWKSKGPESWEWREESGNGALAGSTLLGRERLSDPAVSPSMHTHLDQLAAAGVKSLRIFFHWRDVQPQGPQHYYWDYADVLAIAAHDRGMDILPSLTYTPTWAVAPEYRSKFDSYSYPPQDTADYSRFVTAFVDRYKPGGELARDLGWPGTDGIRYFELGHEFNVSQVFKSNGQIFFSGWLGTLDQYLDMVKAGRDSVKKSCPDCLVVSGAAADDMPPAYPTSRTDPAGWRQYVWQGVEDLYERIQKRHPGEARPADQYFDILNIHTYEWFMLSAQGQFPDEYRAYAFPDPMWYRDRLDNVTDVMRRYGYPDGKVWLTETGFASSDNGDAFGGYLNEAGQAYAVWMVHQEAARYPQVEKVFWWYGYDINTNVGLIGKDFRPKRSYHVYSQLTGKAPR